MCAKRVSILSLSLAMAVVSAGVMVCMTASMARGELVGHWTFDDVTGDEVPDSAGGDDQPVSCFNPLLHCLAPQPVDRVVATNILGHGQQPLTVAERRSVNAAHLPVKRRGLMQLPHHCEDLVGLKDHL